MFKVFKLMLIIFLPSVCFSQILFEYEGKTRIIPIKQNILLVEKYRKMINVIKFIDEQAVINIPVSFQIRHNKKYFHWGNHICEYSYDSNTDEIIYGDNDVMMVEIDCEKKKIGKPKKEKGNEKDHYKPKDKDKKIKDKEKKKTKPTKIGNKIIVR